MNKPFSIVVPVYNREALLTRCLDSIGSQTYRPLRIIVVDNASTDSSRAVAEDWARRHSCPGLEIAILEEKQPGASAARNRGLAEVNTPYMAFFDSDDAMRPTLVEEAVNALESLQGPLKLAIWKEMIHFPSGKSRVVRFARHDLLRNHIIHGIVSTQRFAASTELVRRAGGWNESLPVWNDWELGVRMLLMKPDVRCVPRVLVDNYFTEKSITGTDFSSRCGMWERSVESARTAVGSSRRDDGKRLFFLLDYKKIILAATYSREAEIFSKPAWRCNASRLYESVAGNYSAGGIRRLILRLAFRYTSAGLRGAATLLRPFL